MESKEYEFIPEYDQEPLIALSYDPKHKLFDIQFKYCDETLIWDHAEVFMIFEFLVRGLKEPKIQDKISELLKILVDINQFYTIKKKKRNRRK